MLNHSSDNAWKFPGTMLIKTPIIDRSFIVLIKYLARDTVASKHCAISAFLFLLLTTAGCSHTKPYYRSDLSAPVQVCIDEKDIRYRIILAGDAGDTSVSSPILFSLRHWAEEMPKKTLVMFLGDNIYPVGMPPKEDEQRKSAERCLSKQLAVVKESGARGLFIPGNHDWANGGEDGQSAVKRQEEYINQMLPGDDNFLPRYGCPGPVKMDLDGVQIIVLDTAWWLYKKTKTTSSCDQKDEDSVIEELKRLLTTAGDRQVMVVAHHPLATHGTYGGFYDWRDHLFPSTHLAKWLWLPTPGLGSLYPFFRSHVVRNEQSLGSRAYTMMMNRITDGLSTSRPLIYAAGHDHGLQVLEGGEAADHILVSALGLDRGSALSHGGKTLFAHLHPGFMVVDFMKDREVLLRVVETGEEEVVFLQWLTSAAGQRSSIDCK